MASNNFISLRDLIRLNAKKQFIVLSSTLIVVTIPLICWSISNFYKSSNKYLIESNLNYIQHLITIGDVVELQNHFNSIVNKSGISEIILMDQNDFAVVLESKNKRKVSFFQVSNSILIPSKERNAVYSISYTYPYPTKETISYLFFSIFIVFVYGLVATNLIRRTSRLIEDSFVYLTDIFYKFKKFGIDLDDIKTNKHLPQEVNHIIDVLNENIIQLRETERTKLKLAKSQTYNNLAKQVAHDIRSPLSSLNILAKTSQSMSLQEYSLLNTTIKRINEIAEDLLNHHRLDKVHINELSNLQNNYFKSETLILDSKISIVNSLKEIISEKKLEYSSNKNIEFNLKFDVNLTNLKIRISELSLKRVISNLINNSVEAIPDNQKGIILIHLSNNGDKIILEIQDNGIGIEESILNKVFESGFTFGKIDGNGLGLSYSKSVIESFNGKMNIFSKKNVGTRVLISFPKQCYIK